MQKTPQPLSGRVIRKQYLQEVATRLKHGDKLEEVVKWLRSEGFTPKRIREYIQIAEEMNGS